MPRIIYPEVRTVSEAWVIAQALDQIVNDAVDAHVRRYGPFPSDWDAAEVGASEYDRFVQRVQAEHKDLDVVEAMEILSDSGTVTFGSEDLDPVRWREMEDGDRADRAYDEREED